MSRVELSRNPYPAYRRLRDRVRGSAAAPVPARAPDRFDLRRATVRHMAFSRGPHVCPGAYVARQRVARAALPALLALPGIRLATAVVPYRG